MAVKISNNGFQFSNKPPPKPKPPYDQFPTVLTLSDGRVIRVSVPVPDKLTLVVNITEEIYGPNAPDGLSVAAWVKATGDYLMEQPWNTQHLSHTYYPNKEQPWYEHVKLGMGKRQSDVRFGFDRQTKKYPPRLRLELNPRKLGPAGFKTFLKILSDPKGPFAMKPLLQAARVTRYDVAVDIVGLQVGELVAFFPKQGKRSIYVGKDGLLETINIHRSVSASKPAGKVAVKIYDRVRERLDRGKKPPFGSAPVTRVEIIKMPKDPYNGLLKLAEANNPFGGLRVGYIADQAKPLAWWFQFVTLCRVMPVHEVEALLGLTKSVAETFRTALKVPQSPIVSKSQSWEGWHQGLKVTGLNLLLAAGE